MPLPLLNPPLGFSDRVVTRGVTSGVGVVSPASAKDRFCPPMVGLAWFEPHALEAVQTTKKSHPPLRFRLHVEILTGIGAISMFQLISMFRCRVQASYRWHRRESGTVGS